MDGRKSGVSSKATDKINEKEEIEDELCVFCRLDGCRCKRVKKFSSKSDRLWEPVAVVLERLRALFGMSVELKRALCRGCSELEIMIWMRIKRGRYVPKEEKLSKKEERARKTLEIKVFEESEKKKKEPLYVKKRMFVYQLRSTYYPSIRVLHEEPFKKFIDAYVIDRNRTLKVDVFGKLFEIEITPWMKTREVVEIIGMEEEEVAKNDMVLALKTPLEVKNFRLEEVVLDEIVQWKLEHAFLRVVEEKITEDDMIMEETGYTIECVENAERLERPKEMNQTQYLASRNDEVLREIEKLEMEERYRHYNRKRGDIDPPIYRVYQEVEESEEYAEEESDQLFETERKRRSPKKTQDAEIDADNRDNCTKEEDKGEECKGEEDKEVEICNEERYKGEEYKEEVCKGDECNEAAYKVEICKEEEYKEDASNVDDQNDLSYSSDDGSLCVLRNIVNTVANSVLLQIEDIKRPLTQVLQFTIGVVMAVLKIIEKIADEREEHSNTDSKDQEDTEADREHHPEKPLNRFASRYRKMRDMEELLEPRSPGVAVNLSNRGLKEFPSFIFKLRGVTHLNISNNQITLIPRGINRLGLSHLDASNNMIQMIEETLRIPILNLKNNSISEFISQYVYNELNLLGNPMLVFRGCANILYIREINRTQRIYGAISSLRKVSIIDVEMKQFIGSFPHLKYLQLINNGMEEINIVAPNLEIVLCSHNSLTYIPFTEQVKCKKYFPQLRSISLPYNLLNLISNRVWKLSIEYLNLSYNQILRVEPPIVQKTLRHLNIAGNQIKEVKHIERLTGLVCFIACFNMLEQVEGIESLEHLKLAVLSYNGVQIVPRLFKKEKSKVPETDQEKRALCIIGNPLYSISSQKEALHHQENVLVIYRKREKALLQLPSTVEKHNQCKKCKAYIPREKYYSMQKKAELASIRAAQCAEKFFTIDFGTERKKKPLNVRMVAYYSSQSKRLHGLILEAMDTIEEMFKEEIENNIERQWPQEMKEKVLQLFVEIVQRIYPEKVDILSFVLITERYIYATGLPTAEIVLLRGEQAVSLNAREKMGFSCFIRNPRDECVVVLHKYILKVISMSELITVYMRNKSISEVSEFLISNELKSITALVVPLEHEKVFPKKRTELFAPMFLGSMLTHTMISSQKMKVPVVVFTDVVNSTKMWAADPIKMREVSKIHNNAIRELMRKFGGYEVKTEGDAFMMVFYDEKCAVEFGTLIHSALLHKNWLELAVEYSPMVYSKKHPIYRGLQIRVGISRGACVVENDPTTKRLDFYGKPVIEASRLCSIANGGETLVADSMYSRIREIKTGEYIVIPRGRAVLSGLEKNTYHIYELLHKSLKDRLLLKSQIGMNRFEK